MTGYRLLSLQDDVHNHQYTTDQGIYSDIKPSSHALESGMAFLISFSGTPHIDATTTAVIFSIFITPGKAEDP